MGVFDGAVAADYFVEVRVGAVCDQAVVLDGVEIVVKGVLVFFLGRFEGGESGVGGGYVLIAVLHDDGIVEFPGFGDGDHGWEIAVEGGVGAGDLAPEDCPCAARDGIAFHLGPVSHVDGLAVLGVGGGVVNARGLAVGDLGGDGVGLEDLIEGEGWAVVVCGHFAELRHEIFQGVERSGVWGDEHSGGGCELAGLGELALSAGGDGIGGDDFHAQAEEDFLLVWAVDHDGAEVAGVGDFPIWGNADGACAVADGLIL